MKTLFRICSAFLLFWTYKTYASGLKIEESYNVPTIEISGMAWRKNPKTNILELVLVSDRDYALYVVEWSKRKSNFKVNKIDLSHLKSKSDGKQSEWESVFCDESGRIFIIKEDPAKLIVLNKELKTIEHTISINRRLPDAEENSGPEGILLLKNGHFLVVNEKERLEIVEFGPSSDNSFGYSPDLSIEHQGLFPINKLTEPHVELHSWAPDKSTLEKLQDSSGINIDKDGNIYLLSDEKKSVTRLGNNLNPKDHTFSGTKYWGLPDGIKNPEGMVIDPQGRPIIAIDIKNSNKMNLFVLSKLN